MIKNSVSNKKNNSKIRFSILFFTLIVSHLSLSCFKEKNNISVAKTSKTGNLITVNFSPIYAEIHDANFKAYLKTIVPDAFTPDNKFISNHPSVVSYDKSMSIRNKKFTSLSGIEYFISLTRLDCIGNQLTTLDVSKNIALTELFCGDNQLISLDVSRNTKLKVLESSHNQLTNLDVSKNTNLKELNCYRNQLTAITIGENNVLRKIFCPYNQLTILDVSHNTGLIELACTDNPRTTVVIINPNTLSRLYIDYYIVCSHPSIKAFKDRGGEIYGSLTQEMPPFTCP